MEMRCRLIRVKFQHTSCYVDGSLDFAGFSNLRMISDVNNQHVVTIDDFH